MYYIQKDGAADCAQEKCKQVEAAAEANAAKAAAHDAAQDKCFKMEVEFAGTIRLGTRRVKEEGIRALGTQAKPPKSSYLLHLWLQFRVSPQRYVVVANVT
jgi:hypothetical protein